MLKQTPQGCTLTWPTAMTMPRAGKVEPAWRALFLDFPDRFLVGTDTFTPERWHYIVEHAEWSRGWLADLPKGVAEKIGWRNGETLFASMMAGK
jgi:hypothetical protein